MAITLITKDLFRFMNARNSTIEDTFMAKSFNDNFSIDKVINDLKVNSDNKIKGDPEAIGYTFSDEQKFANNLALLNKAKSIYKTRGFFDKLFHPIRTIKENLAIKSLNSDVKSMCNNDDDLIENCNEALSNRLYTTNSNNIETISSKGINEISDFINIPLSKEEESEIERYEKSFNERYNLDSKFIQINSKLKVDIQNEELAKQGLPLKEALDFNKLSLDTQMDEQKSVINTKKIETSQKQIDSQNISIE